MVRYPPISYSNNPQRCAGYSDHTLVESPFTPADDAYMQENHTALWSEGEATFGEDASDDDKETQLTTVIN